MEQPTRIATFDELRRYLTALFEEDITAEPSTSYDIMFMVDGKIKPRLAQLQAKTGTEGWSGESRFYHYTNEALNVTIGISSAPGGVIVIACLSDKHREALIPYGGSA